MKKKMKDEHDYKICIDFSDHTKLYEKILKLSRYEMRPIDIQILYYLKKTLGKRLYQNENENENEEDEE